MGLTANILGFAGHTGSWLVGWLAGWLAGWLIGWFTAVKNVKTIHCLRAMQKQVTG